MKKLTIDTNPFLKDRQKRRDAIFRSVIASSRIEGISLTKAQQDAIAERIAERFRKDRE